MKRISIQLLVFCTCVALAAWSQARPHRSTIITFDVPGAGTGLNQGTFPAQNDEAGRIVGYSVDGDNVAHGFLRAANGSISVFDPPGAAANGPGTFALG